MYFSPSFAYLPGLKFRYENQISEFLQSELTRKICVRVYLVAEKSEIVLQDALGLAVVEPEKIEAK